MNKISRFSGLDMDFKAHCFPTLQTALMHENADEESAGLFQPLYRCGSGNTQQFARGNAASHPSEIEAAELEEKRQQGFQRGFQAGQLEARRLCTTTLSPGLKDFLDCSADVARQSQHLITATADQIIALALAVAEKVLNAPTCVTPEDLADIHTALRIAIGDAYGLTLCFHPDDLKCLQDLSEVANFKWSDHSTVLFQNDPEVTKGSLKAHPVSSQRPELEMQLSKDLEAFRYPQNQNGQRGLIGG